MTILRRLLRIFFYHFYHSLAWTYDIVAATVSIGKWKRWVLAAMPYIEGPAVLELGHGPGHLQVAAQQQGLQIVGLDESRQMSRQAANRLRRNGFIPHLVSGYAQDLPFPACFNTVVSTFPSEYIVDRRTLGEAYRVLVPGGRLIVLPMAWIGGNAPPERAAAWLFRVTGESAEDRSSFEQKIKVPFSEAGFRVDVELLSVGGSTLLFVLARKPAPQ